MLRELKFKSYWKNEKTDEIGTDFHEIKFGARSFSGSFQQSNYRELVGFCQFTGLKDKNGKEIYEGDILQGNEHSGVVKWQDAVASFYVECSDGPFALNEGNISKPTQLGYTVVMGNIYENDDLLK